MASVDSISRHVSSLAQQAVSRLRLHHAGEVVPALIPISMGTCTTTPVIACHARPVTASAGVQDLVASGQLSARARLLVTGHSMGGALAVLAAFDIKQAISSLCLELYTYGTPYPGNRAYAREFNELLPEAWHVIHDGVRLP